MNQSEHLQKIRAKCLELIATSLSRNDGWGGTARAAWRTTVAVIDTALECESWDEYIKAAYIRQDAEEILKEITSQWPEELL